MKMNSYKQPDLGGEWIHTMKLKFSSSWKNVTFSFQATRLKARGYVRSNVPSFPSVLQQYICWSPCLLCHLLVYDHPQILGNFVLFKDKLQVNT